MNYTITVTGVTLADIEAGIDAAKESIIKGNVEGHCRDDERDYFFVCNER